MGKVLETIPDSLEYARRPNDGLSTPTRQNDASTTTRPTTTEKTGTKIGTSTQDAYAPTTITYVDSIRPTKPYYPASKSFKRSDPAYSPTNQKPSASNTKKFTSNNDLLSSNLYRNMTDEEKREFDRQEFYKTYDVMTGIRIAATLGGFFGLMVFLILYKSRSRSSKALKDPTIKAVAEAVVQEEEDRELQEAIEATAFSLFREELDLNFTEMQRERLLSLGNVSAPPVLNRKFKRFASFGGYSTLMNPSRRYSLREDRLRRKSSSVSSKILSAYNMGGSFGQDDFLPESEDEEAEEDEFEAMTTAESGYPNNFLSVPNKSNDSRRLSAMTCCSTESSFLERRCSAITLGLSSMQNVSRSPSRQQSRDRDRTELDSLYPGINIIEPTPKTSPCPSSERIGFKSLLNDRYKKFSEDNSFDSISEYPNDENNHNSNPNRQGVFIIDDNSFNPTTYEPRRAPLASLSSFKMSSAEYQDTDAKSLGSDSLFCDSYADTDEDLQQFSTDSDELSITNPEEDDHQLAAEDQTIAEDLSNDQNELGATCNSSLQTTIQNSGENVASGTTNTTIVEIDRLNEINPNLSSCISSNSLSLGEYNYRSQSVNLINQIETKAIIERHEQNDKTKVERPASYSGSSKTRYVSEEICNLIKNHNISRTDKNDNNESHGDADVTKEATNNKSSSVVILELPILTVDDEIAATSPSPSLDPSGPSSRKWSKETLF